jgi:uncharacterized protein YuzE
MIRTNYDPASDVLHVGCGPEDARSETSEEVAPGVYVEFDPEKDAIGVEITSAHKRGSAPSARPQAA